jgi:hypothetical protein
MGESALSGAAIMDFFYESKPAVRAHRAPDPAPVDEPVPEPPHQPHPVPQDDPVPDHNPSRTPG